ncbi:hypothetical protein TNCV_1783711 [Trichonephila clavipes]|nr:hypothetical protein TNCV_1783711 [Trichonephila clavipes]
MKCRGHGYDGAANMNGAYVCGGLQKLIKDKQPRANYAHCSTHNLNLVLNDACNNVLHLIFQCQILQSINLTTNALQSPKIDLENAKTMLNSSLTSIENLRNNFANIKEGAIGLAKKWGITPEFEKKRHRKFRQFFDDFNADEKLKTENGCLRCVFLRPMLMLLLLN